MIRFSSLKKLLAGLLVIALLAGCAGKSRRPEPPAVKPAQPAAQDPEAAAREDPENLLPKEAEPESSAEPEEPEIPETPETPREPLPRICIDPGHYAGVNQFTDADGVTYCEGDFVLEVALHLRRILWDKYGIETVLTRETGSISLGGYTDWDLDEYDLGHRGSYAAEQDCDFFISLHTNANLDGANGYPTLDQPIGITKTVVLANIPCCESERWLHVANEIGRSMSETNYALGLADKDSFMEGSVGQIPDWSDEWNDSLVMPGAVLRRLGERGDYYAVLRAAAGEGVPGIILEHGFHTVPEMRKLAADGTLAEAWAEADADGIAAGLGLDVNR